MHACSAFIHMFKSLDAICIKNIFSFEIGSAFKLSYLIPCHFCYDILYKIAKSIVFRACVC